MKGINKIHVSLDIEIQGHDNDLGLWTEEVGCVENDFYFGCNISFGEVIKGFQGPDDFCNDEQAGDELDFALDCLSKKHFGSFSFDGIIISQKTEKDIGVNKDLSHRPSLFDQCFF